MDNFDLRCMQGSVRLASSEKGEGLGVCVVVRLDDNRIMTSCSNSGNKSAWLGAIKKKLSIAKVSHVAGIYLTINTLSHDGEFDLNKLLEKVSADKVYVGMPDPELNSYIIDDPVVKQNFVFRYPDSLQKNILQQNSTFFAKSRQNIKFSPYYSNVRISKLVQSKLKEKGVCISDVELGANKSVDKLAKYLSEKSHISLKKASEMVNNALSKAFNDKYAIYDDKNDARFLAQDWAKNFEAITKKHLSRKIEQMNVINVGVGNGEEASRLFAKCKNITFVDIAPGGLKKIKQILPWAQVFKTRAEKLNGVDDDLFNVYVSLRTYNSSFFDVAQALSQARRVLKDSGALIISVANGFLCEDGSILPGLIIPGREFVDIYRGIDVVKELKSECERLGFILLEICPTTTEIYLVGYLKKDMV